MAILREKEGMTRRQFVKGLGVLGAALAISGSFFKFGYDAHAVSTEYIAKRAAGLYQLDKEMPIRKSHANPEIKQIYSEFLGKPLSEKSEHLLHTTYSNRYQALAG